MLGPSRQIADHNRGQGVGALQPHKMAGIKIDAQDVGARPVRHQLAPVRAFRCGERRGRDPEIDGAARAGENEQFVAAIGHAVAHALFARRDQARLGVG